VMLPALVSAQTGQGEGSGFGGAGNDQSTGSGSATSSTGQKDARAATVTTKIEEAQPNARFVRTLTNVQIELTLTDQSAGAAPDKKIVSMIVSSGSWGKIRSAGSLRPVGEVPFGIDLNVDARPFVSVDGPIQLELTLNYSPPGLMVAGRDKAAPRTGLNQSQTVILHSGKPLVISQAADPVGDRKVVVEVKATVIK